MTVISGRIRRNKKLSQKHTNSQTNNNMAQPIKCVQKSFCFLLFENISKRNSRLPYCRKNNNKISPKGDKSPKGAKLFIKKKKCRKQQQKNSKGSASRFCSVKQQKSPTGDISRFHSFVSSAEKQRHPPRPPPKSHTPLTPTFPPAVPFPHLNPETETRLLLFLGGGSGWRSP